MADSDFKHASRYAESLGISEGVLKGWIDRFWQKGVQYVVIGHQTLVHVPRGDQWISEHGQLESGPAEPGSRSESSKAGNVSIMKRLPETHIKRVTSPQR
jgi:hypothetical protein